MINAPLPRIDLDDELRNYLLKFCRLKPGEVWNDPQKKHKVACLGVEENQKVKKLFNSEKAVLAIHDPPYNFIAFGKKKLEGFIKWCESWVKLTNELLDDNSSLYIWLGADQNEHYQPLPQFMQMMEN